MSCDFLGHRAGALGDRWDFRSPSLCSWYSVSAILGTGPFGSKGSGLISLQEKEE